MEMQRVKRFVFNTIVFVGALLVFISGWLLIENEFIINNVKSGEVKIDSYDELDSLTPILVAPLKQTLNQDALTATLDNDVALKISQEYIKRKPIDPQGWLWQSLYHQRAGDLPSAEKSLKVAHRLSTVNTPMLINVFNRYLELNLIAPAMDVARDISYSQPQQFRQIFYLMSRLNPDYEEVVEEKEVL